MLKSRSSLLLLLGLVLAGVTAFALYRVASDARTVAPVQAPAATETVSAIVAKVDIPARTVVTAAMLVRRPLPKEAIPASVVRDEAEAIGQTSLGPIPSGALILKPQLAAVGGEKGLSVTVDPGKVLVAFPTSDPLTLAGFVTVGDHIDLLATVVSGAGENARKTQTIVQNLTVVDVLGPTPEEPSRPRALTFVVDHQVALFLKYLRDSQATVDVVVRSRSEDDAVRTQSVNVQVLQETFGIK